MSWLCGTVLALSALAVNWRVLDFGFLYLRDDDVNIALNPHMGGLAWERLRWIFTDWSYVRRYIPLGWLNLSATYQVSGLNPAGYHAVGLVLYLLNSVLVLVLILHALRLFTSGRASGLSPWDVGAAALASAWWALHPMRVETTAWASGNLYGQAMALLSLSLIAYLRSYLATGTRRAVWIALAALGYTLSLLTYPLAFGVPILLLGLDWLRCRSQPGLSFRQLVAEKAAFFVPLALVLAVTLTARYESVNGFGAVPSLRDLSLLQRVAQSAYVAAYYVWKPWWPAHLSPLYDALMDFSPTGGVFLASMEAVGAVSVAAILAFRRRPAISVAWFGYLAAAAPFFGLTEKPHMTSDRYGYFLAVIMASFLAVGLSRLTTRRARVAAAVISLAAIGILGRLTWAQLGIWSDDRLQHAYIAAHLTNAELLDDFNSRLLTLEFLRGNEKEAADAVAARLARDPNGQGFQKAAAIIADKRRLSTYFGPVSYLAILHDHLGLNFAHAGEFREANDHFEEALRMDPRLYQAAYDRALVLLNLGRSDDALRSYFIAEHWASPPLTTAQRRGFLGLLEHSAASGGESRLAGAARNALAR